MFTPFINYTIRKMGGDDSCEEQMNTALVGKTKASRILGHVLTLAHAHLLEQNLLKEGDKRLTMTACSSAKVCKAMTTFISDLET